MKAAAIILNVLFPPTGTLLIRRRGHAIGQLTLIGVAAVLAILDAPSGIASLCAGIGWLWAIFSAATYEPESQSSRSQACEESRADRSVPPALRTRYRINSPNDYSAYLELCKSIPVLPSTHPWHKACQKYLGTGGEPYRIRPLSRLPNYKTNEHGEFSALDDAIKTDHLGFPFLERHCRHYYHGDMYDSYSNAIFRVGENDFVEYVNHTNVPLTNVPTEGERRRKQQKEEAAAEERALWTTAVQQDTPEAYRAYLQKSKKKKFAQEAKEYLAALRQQRLSANKAMDSDKK